MFVDYQKCKETCEFGPFEYSLYLLVSKRAVIGQFCERSLNFIQIVESFISRRTRGKLNLAKVRRF